MILITGAHKAFALYNAIEEGVNHMWTVSAFQQHPQTVFVCDEDATQELKVKTVKYFKGNKGPVTFYMVQWSLSVSTTVYLLRECRSEHKNIKHEKIRSSICWCFFFQGWCMCTIRWWMSYRPTIKRRIYTDFSIERCCCVFLSHLVLFHFLIKFILCY